MPQLRERPQLREHEVDERFHEIVKRADTLVEEPVRKVPAEKRPVEVVEKRPIRWMQWLAAFIVVAAGAVVVAVLAIDDGVTPEVYTPDPYAEMEIIDGLVADWNLAHPVVFTYTADPYAELDLITQAVADYRTAHPYVANAYAELALIEQAIFEFDHRPSTYVPDPYAELEFIAAAQNPASTYVPDPYVELALIRSAVVGDPVPPVPGSTYIADAYVELDLIAAAIADAMNPGSTYVPDPSVELDLIARAVAGEEAPLL